MDILNLFAKIELDSGKFTKGLDNAEKQAKSFSSRAGTVFKTVGKAVTATIATVTALTAVISASANAVISFGDDIDKTSQKLGVSAKAYQEWSILTQMAGSDVATLQTGIRALNNWMTKLAEGQGDALLTLQKLGIGYDEFMSMDNDTRLKAVVEAMQGLEDQTEKTTVAQELFGSRAYMELMPLLNMQKGEVDKLFESYHELGLVMSDDMVKASAKLSDMMTIMKTAFKTAGAVVMEDFFGSFESIIGGLTDLATGVDGGVDRVVEGIKGLLDKVLAIAPDLIKGLGDILSKVIVSVVELIPTILLTAVDLVGVVVETLLKMDWGKIIVSLIEVIIFKLPEAVMLLVTSLIKLFTDFLTQGIPIDTLLDVGKNLGKAFINGFIATLEGGMNFIIATANAITGVLSSLWTWIPSLENTGIPKIPEVKIPRLAKGGFVDNFGSLFMAGEGGAEIVASGRFGTGVANVEQIAEAVEVGTEPVVEAVRSATVAIINALAEIASRQGKSGQQNVNVSLNGDMLKALDNKLVAKGRKSLSGVTVY